MAVFETGTTVKTTKYALTVPALAKDEYEALKRSIAEHGLHEAITISPAGDILDGHHRFQACQELGIKPAFKVKEFSTELEEQIFVFETNLKRRQLNTFQKAELALKEKPILAKLAERNMSLGGKGSKNLETLHVDKELAKQAGVSNATLFKVEQLVKTVERGPDHKLGLDFDGRYRGRNGPSYGELLQNARAGKLTPSKAYSLLKREQETLRKRSEAEASAKLRKLPDKVILINADSTKFEEITELEDNSVDLIFTDPPYLKGNLEMFDALARLACKKLKTGGSLVFFYGQFQQPEIHEVFAKYKDQLSWAWCFCVHHNGHTARFHAAGVWVEWKPLVWFVKGKLSKRLTAGVDLHDFVESTKPDKAKHPWAQSGAEAQYFIRKLTVNEHSLVVDPFLGSGAFAIPAIKLRRWFLGIEIDGTVLGHAKNNIAATTMEAQA